MRTVLKVSFFSQEISRQSSPIFGQGHTTQTAKGMLDALLGLNYMKFCLRCRLGPGCQRIARWTTSLSKIPTTWTGLFRFQTNANKVQFKRLPTGIICRPQSDAFRPILLVCAALFKQALHFRVFLKMKFDKQLKRWNAEKIKSRNS